MMDRQTLRQKRKQLYEGNKAFGESMTEIPMDQWPARKDSRTEHLKVFRSRHFFAQVVKESGHIRISVNRSEIDDNGGWKDGISWDQLMRVKSECGYADRDAVELYPSSDSIVNVANIRHLWILNEPPTFKWNL